MLGIMKLSPVQIIPCLHTFEREVLDMLASTDASEYACEHVRVI